VDPGSEHTFEDFVERRMMSLFGAAYLLVGDVHQAEDLLQAALEKVYRRWRRIETMDHPEAYVRRVIVNLANDRWRRRRRAVEVAIDEAETASRPDDTDLIDLRQELIDGLQKLPIGMRTVLVLRYWEGLTDAQVAAELGRSVGTVKSQASRGLERLRGLADRRHGAARDVAPTRADRGGGED
jgi:RNA polymerase sigma-70 factor (sigma-E family)